MPIIETEASVKAAKAAEARSKRREGRAEARESGTAVGKDAETVSIPESKMIGLPEGVVIGSNPGLFLTLTCPKMKDALRIQNTIYEQWPDVLLFAATGDIGGRGVNPEQVAQFWNLNAKAQALRTGLSANDVPEIGDREVRSLMANLSLNIETYLPRLCDTLWPLCSATVNLHWPRRFETVIEEQETTDETTGIKTTADVEVQKLIDVPDGDFYFDDAVMEYLAIPDLADLLRAVLACMGGYPGDFGSRFP